MPIYEYRCQSCGHTFEKFQQASSEPPSCPSCGHSEADRVMSATSFQLKGEGWYVTDFKGDKKDKPAAPSAGASEAKVADGGKSEAKPAASAKSDKGEAK